MMKLDTIAELKIALNQQADATPLEVYTTEGNRYTHAEIMTIDGALRITLERKLEATVEETVAEMNREFVFGAAR